LIRQDWARRPQFPTVRSRGSWTQQRCVVPCGAATCRVGLQQSVRWTGPICVLARVHLCARTSVWDA